MTFPPAPGPSWVGRGRRLVSGRPVVMGIVNVTPDSFSDGGLASDRESAVALAQRLVAEGADVLDIGGESSRPGAEPVSTVEELRRVVPVVAAIAESLDVPISVDTTKAEVARQAIDAGAHVINDITALGDPAMGPLVAETGAGIVLMHMQGTPRTMQEAPHYDDVVSEVLAFLVDRVARAERSGIPRDRIAIDPGIGFGKTHEHNVALLRAIERFASTGLPVLVGASRKGFLGTITGRARHERAVATVAASLSAASLGARVLRVHDVGPMVDAVKVWGELHGWGRSG